MYQGYGVHHTVIGVRNLETMRSFYRDLLEFNNIFAEFPAGGSEALREITRTSHPIKSSVFFSQEAGGIIVGLTQMIEPVPRAP